MLGRSFPNSIVGKTKKMLYEAGSSVSPYKFLAYVSTVSFILFILFLSLSYYLDDLKQILSSLAVDLLPSNIGILYFIFAVLLSVGLVIGFLVLLTSYYAMKSDARRNALEAILPDFLALVSSNVRSGMNLDQAMWQAAKPEFGILALEVKTSIKSSFSGQPIEKALEDLGNKFNSDLFKRALNILRHSIYSGGEIAVVLEKVAEEASELALVRREIRSTLLVYVIFLFFASAVGIPFLLSVSGKMLEILTSTFSLVDTSSSSSDIANSFGYFSVSKPPITPKQFFWFSILVIIISSITTSLLIGAAYAGRKSEGLKYLIFIFFVGIMVFFGAQYALSIFFSNFIPGSTF